MAISSTQYIDLLFKSLSGVAKTDLPANKSASNEAIASPILNRGDQTWTEANLIPSTAAAVAGVVQAYTGSSKATATAETTAQAVGGVFPSWRTNLSNWIPPQFDNVNITNTYRVKIYYGAAGLNDPATSGGTQIFADGSGGTGEWYFDYASGVLNFIGGTIPAGMTGSSVIYVYGYRYVGKVGITNLPAITASGTSTFSSITALNAALTATTVSVSTTTGALVVNGGVGIAGSTFIGGDLTVSGTINATIQGSVTTATNIAGGTAGQLVYQSAPGSTTFAGPGTAGQLLVSGGTSAPVYTNTGSIYVGRAIDADKWRTSRTVTFTGDTTGTFTIDGSSDVTNVNLTIQPDSVALGTDTTGDYVATGATSGFGLSGSTTGENQTFTVTSNATSTNANSTIVFRDGSGNFSAGTITAATAFSGTLGTGSAQTISTNALSLSGYADNTGVLYFSNGSGLIASNSASFAWDNSAGVLRVKTSTAASSTTTGALVVTGGVGVGGNLYVGGEIVAQKLTIELTTITTTLVETDDIIKTSNTTNATSTTTGALVVAGGAGIGNNLYVGGTIFGSLTGLVTTSTNIAGGTAGQVPYQTAAGATSFYGPGTAGQILVSGGTSAPVYTNTGSIYVGRAVDADKWTAARTITLSGDLGGTASFDGSSNFTLTATIQADSVALGTDTTGDYVATGATSGFGLSGSTTGENQTFTVTSNATSSNVTSTIVFRDGSGNFSAGTITGLITTATNVAGGTAGQLVYQSAAGTTTFAGPGTAGQLLVSGGTSAPVYTNTGSIYVGRAIDADKWRTARTVTFTGDTTGTFSIDGSADVTSVNLTIQPNSVELGTDTTGDYIAAGGVTGFGLSGSASGESSTFTVSSNATSTNANSTLVFRDSSGNFSAGTITASLTGTASQADKWSTARTITLDGDLSGSISIDGTSNVTLTATIQANSVALGSDTTGNYVASGATSGFGISGSANSETATFTVNINSTSSNTTSTIVYRDASGNFAANTITAALSGNATSADKWSTAKTVTFTGDTTGTFTIDGSADVSSVNLTIQPNSVELGTDTTGNYVATGATTGFGLTGSTNAENATFTVGINSTSSNTTSTVVFRDGSGNFSANVITADVVGTASSANDLTGGAAGSLPYQTGAGVTVFLPLGLDGKVLQVSTATNAPVWGDIDGGTY